MNDVYRERAQLVAVLSKIFPASIEKDPRQVDWDVVFIDFPTGQASWHVSKDDLSLFSHLPKDTGRIWDGHSTEEKYQRLARFESKDVLESPQVLELIDGFTQQLDSIMENLKEVLKVAKNKV